MMYKYTRYIDFFFLIFKKVLTYATGMEHLGGNMFESITIGDAIFMKVSFIFYTQFVLSCSQDLN